MDERVCPSVDEIRDFLNERLAPARDQELSLHIQVCQSCSELMTTVVDSDETQDHGDLLPVLAEIRTVQKDQSFEAEDACLRAIERARQIPEQSSSSAPGSEVNDIAERVSPPSMLGPYELGAEIGTGGMGSVYRATHSKLGRTVAVKILHGRRMSQPDAIARFEREMKAVGQLEHPNIVRATDADEEDGVQYLVMEYLDGVDLSSLIRQRGPLPVAEACELVRQAANGLQHAHENGFVHRDVKPANLMLCATQNGGANDTECRATVAPHSVRKAPCVKVLDLGLALLEEPESGDALTSTGQVMGTIEYMAPEQFDETSQVDIRADIYSLGATLYKLLTGHSPLESEQPRSRLQKLKALATEEPAPISDHRSDLPTGLIDIIGRMLACSPNDRYATPHEVAEALLPLAAGNDLAALLDSTGTDQSVVSVAHRSAAPGRKSPRGSRLLEAAFAAFAIAVLIVFIQREPKSTPSEVARSDSIRLENRTLIYEDHYASADRIVVRSDGDTLTLQGDNTFFLADIEDEDTTHKFSIRTSEFDGLRLLLGQGDDQLTLEGISGINGDLVIDGGEGENSIDVRGSVDLGPHSLTMTAARIVLFSEGHISSSDNGSIYLEAGDGIISEGEACIQLQRGSTIRTEQGDITLLADASDHTTWSVHGVHSEGATIESQSGAITLKGRASTGAGNGYTVGVGLLFDTTVCSTGIGAEIGQILINGSGGAGGSRNRGVCLENSEIESHDAEIRVSGKGGTSDAGVRNDGVCIRAGTITSHDGDLSVSGVGGSGAGDNLGVSLFPHGHLKTTGNGQIRVDGEGGAGSRRGEENNIGIHFGSSERPEGKIATIQSTSGPISLIGRGGNGVSRGVVISGEVSTDDSPLSISGTGSGGAADFNLRRGMLGSEDSKGEIKLIADSVIFEGEAITTAGNITVSTRTTDAMLEVGDDTQASNYLNADDWPIFSSRIGSLTILDQRGHAWRRKTFDGQLQWSQLIDGEETATLPDEPSFAINWAIPKRLSAPLDQGEGWQSFAFTADELLVVLASARTGSVGGGDLWMAERESVEKPFSEFTNLGTSINTVQLEHSVSISRDGLTLVYASDCTETQERGPSRIWMATRTSRSESFLQPTRLDLLVGVAEQDGWVSFPSLSPDGNELFFSANSDHSKDTNIFVATRPDSTSSFGPGRRLDKTINSDKSEMSTAIHPDGRTLVFSSTRPGSLGGYDLWAARRDSAGEPFGEPVHLGNVINSPTSETAPFVSRDGRTLYFACKESRTKAARVFLYQIAFPTGLFSQ
jgi:serine/threonine protein kinase